MRGRLLQNLVQTRRLFYEYLTPRANSVITYSRLKQAKQFSTNNQIKDNDDGNERRSSHNLAGSVASNYKAFDDKDAEIILDVSEIQGTINIEDLRINEEVHDPYEGINLERGVTGVYEIEDLVLLLQKDNAKNIFVASVPPEMSYVDYIVVVTGKSHKHMKALATFVRKVYKIKKHKEDSIPKIEGENSKDWIALDLGNIALHIFSSSARPLYDLETLWSVGPDYDDKNRIVDVNIMDQFNTFLSDLQPLEENDEANNEIVESNNK